MANDRATDVPAGTALPLVHAAGGDAGPNHAPTHPGGHAGGGFPVEVSMEDSRPVPALPTGPARALAPALPVVPHRPYAPPQPLPEATQKMKERIDALVKEARAQHGSAAAALWFDAGGMYEHELGDLRNAAAHYQEAHKADPAFVPVIHAARRLFAQLGKWGMVVVLLDEELKLPGAPTATLLIEKARIHEAKLGKPDDALALYRQALAVDKGAAAAVDAVVRHLTLKGAYKEVIDVLRAAADSTPRADLKVAWLLELARMLEARAQDDAGALACYEAAHRLAPRRRNALEGVRRLSARRGDLRRLVEVLGLLAEAAGTSAEAVPFLFERARLCAQQGDDAAAVLALEVARERQPGDTLVLAELGRLYERLGSWAALCEVYEAQAAATHDVAERVALQGEAARLAEERIGDPEKAIALYRRCMEEDPSHHPALVALGKLYAKTGRLKELSGIFDVQIAATTEPHQRVPLLYKQAELLADKLGDSDAALERFLKILLIQPGYVPALKAASAIYSQQHRWEDLVRMYEGELSTQVDRDQAIFLLEKIAALCEQQLLDPQRAIEAYKRMLDVVPGYLPALRSLGRLYSATERWDDLIAANVEEAQIVTDQNHVVSLLFRNGEILAEKLQRHDDAIASYRQALQLMPNYLPALKALGMIYARAQRWTDLVAMHRQEAEVARTNEARAHLLYQVAQIYEEKLQDPAAAVKAYHEVLAEVPAHHTAIRALARIAQQAGDWQALIAVHTTELKTLAEPRDRALMRCRIADTLDRQLGKVDEAVRALEEALAESPALLAAHELLVMIHARGGRAAEEAIARERMQAVLADVDGRLANLRALVELYMHRLDDPTKALHAAARILAEAADDRSALRASMTCALRVRDYRAAIDHAQRLARIEPSPDEVANLHMQIAVWKESHVDPPMDALPDYVRVLEFDPENPTAIRAVERAYVERAAWDGLYALYERERARAKTPVLVADFSMKLGEIAERRLGDLERATPNYEAALAAMPGHLSAITRLKEIYGAARRVEDQMRLLGLEAAASRDPAHAIKTLLEVGALQRDRFGNVDAAVKCFFSVLDRDPMHPEAYTSLESLLVANSRWDQLVELYRRRAEATPGDAQKVEALLKAAHLLRERLQDGEGAAAMYERVLALMPSHPSALLHLGNVRFAHGAWDRAVEAYGKLVLIAGDPGMTTPVHMNLGVIFTEHLVDAPRAIQSLTSVLAMQPENREARRRLALAYGLAGSPAQALATYRQLLESSADRAERLSMLRTIAQLYETTFGDLVQAAQHLEQAIACTDDPTLQGQLLEQVSTLFERTGNLQGYLEVSRSQAEQVAASDPRRAAELYFRNARLLLDKNKDLEGAARAARRGLEIAPDHVELRGFLADLYARVPAQASLAVEEHRRILRAGRVRVASLRALFRAWSQQRAFDRAYVAAELLSFLGVADESEELFFAENKKRVRRESDAQMTPVQLTGFVVHPVQRNVVREILCAVAVELGKGLPDNLDAYAVEKKDILKPKADDMLRTLCDGVALNLGAPPFDVHRSRANKNVVEAHNGSPLVLVVGQDVTRANQTREQRFLVGRKLMALQSGHALLVGMRGDDLKLLMTAIGRAQEKSFPLLADGPSLERLTKTVSSALSRGTRKLITEPLAQLAAEASRVDWQAYVDAVPMTEARAGLVVCGAFESAVRLVARDFGRPLPSDPSLVPAALEANPVLADLVAYAPSDDHFSARQASKFAIDA